MCTHVVYLEHRAHTSTYITHACTFMPAVFRICIHITYNDTHGELAFTQHTVVCELGANLRDSGVPHPCPSWADHPNSFADPSP